FVKPRIAEHRRESRQRDVEGHARHDLVAVVRDAREGVQEAHHDRRGDADAESDPGRARDGRGRGRREGRGQQLALEADVANAGALGKEAAERRQHERRRPARRRRRQKGRERKGVAHERTTASTGPRNACSSAPQTRMISPWMTTTMSRVRVGMSNDSSEPPWYRPPNSTAASTMPTG